MVDFSCDLMSGGLPSRASFGHSAEYDGLEAPLLNSPAPS